MADGVTGSTVPRRQLGRYLRDLRNRSRLTVRGAAQRLEWSEAKIWRIETGQTSLRSLDVETMCRIYGAEPELSEALMGLAKETKARGWWHSYGDVIPEYFDVYIGLEESAASLAWYEPELIPGLLQTEAYTRTLIRGADPAVNDAELERRVQVRVARQALLTRATRPPVLEVVLNEAVLRRPVGGASVLASQLERLMEVSALPNVSLRVMPFAAGLHVGMVSGPFVTLRFPVNAEGRETEPPTVYVDGFTGALYLDKPAEIERYDTAFREIWKSALGESATLDLIQTTARELE
jgi:transcriptional regulator with XRE-family HTH domain